MVTDEPLEAVRTLRIYRASRRCLAGPAAEFTPGQGDRLPTLIKRAGGSLLRRATDSGRKGRGRVVVLVYHSVHRTQPNTNTKPEMFKDHIEWLTDCCEVVPLAEIPERATAASGSRPCVAITFDDGFANNYEHALPVLLDHGVAATFFITTGLVNGDERVTARFSRLLGIAQDEVRGLSWRQLQEMRAEGMSIGAHTVTHPNLGELGPDDTRRELELSKRELEDRLGSTVRSFAYPFGKPKHHFTETTIRQVQELGFSHAVAVHHRGVLPGDRRFCIPRFAIADEDIAGLSRKVTGKADGVGIWQQVAPRWLSHFVSMSNSFRGEQSFLDSKDAD